MEWKQVYSKYIQKRTNQRTKEKQKVQKITLKKQKTKYYKRQSITKDKADKREKIKTPKRKMLKYKRTTSA